MPRFVRRTDRHLDIAFLHEERLFLERERSALHVMERHRDHLVREIEHARALAKKAHIPIDAVRHEQAPEGHTLLSLIGIGNRMRRDDGAGLEVARRLREMRPDGVAILEQEGEPASLIDAWSGVDEALVIDGVLSGAPPGTLHRFEVGPEPLPAETFRPSTHALGVADAVELARRLDRLPPRLVVYGIEGEDFEVGEGLTPVVEDVVGRLVAELHTQLGAGR